MRSSGTGMEFSFSTVKDFDSHIAQEIRGYKLLDKILVGLADAVIETESNVYDIGCSTGRLINTLASGIAAETDDSRKRKVEFIGIDPNQNFARNFAPANDSVRFRRDRVTSATKFHNASLITSVFTLQFVPIRERRGIVRNIYAGLNASGAFVLAEKVYAGDSTIERLINDRHIEFKRQVSSAEHILDKDRRLRAIMRPLTLADNLDMLESAGFSKYECFWRINNFAAIIAVK
jgi:tRNA (cmo5U34)-methyltransferase